ncbi:MAG: hypothetical protein II649_12135 [Kiritimatiellae bacterium]|nr:hypothetical protein [Kiritimatiellia bacterium]
MNTPTATAAVKPKQYDTIYEGPATIVSTDATDLRFTDGLTKEEAASGFIVVLRVQPKDEKISQQTIELEFSDREGRGNYVGKKQKDVTREELFAHKLIGGQDAASANVAEIFDASVVGKEIMVRVTKTTDPNKKPDKQVRVNCYLSNRSPALSAAERARRIAKLTGQPVPASAPAAAPASTPVTANPF